MNRQKADEAFNNYINEVSRAKGDVGKVVKEFIHSNLNSDEYFEFCQAIGAVCMPDEDFEPVSEKQG